MSIEEKASAKKEYEQALAELKGHPTHEDYLGSLKKLKDHKLYKYEKSEGGSESDKKVYYYNSSDDEEDPFTKFMEKDKTEFDIKEHLGPAPPTDNSDIEKPEMPFYTPTMMMETMNKTMSNVGGEVELKRKLPDGTQVRATKGDMKPADLQAKMRQSAESIINLTNNEKIEWSKSRRQKGNDFYKRGEFQQAMDIYTTCLVAISSTKTSTEEEIAYSDKELQLPVLQNLAACALALGMSSKCIQFCDCALALESGVGKTSYTLFRRRGKAKLKKGEYTSAREDFREALSLAEKVGGEEDADVSVVNGIKQDLVKLADCMKRGEINSKKQKKAMQSVLGGSGGGGNLDLGVGGKKEEEKKKNISGLYEDVELKHTTQAVSDGGRYKPSRSGGVRAGVRSAATHSAWTGKKKVAKPAKVDVSETGLIVALKNVFFILLEAFMELLGLKKTVKDKDK